MQNTKRLAARPKPRAERVPGRPVRALGFGRAGWRLVFFIYLAHLGYIYIYIYWLYRKYIWILFGFILVYAWYIFESGSLLLHGGVRLA